MTMPLNSSPGSLNRAAGWVNLAAFISCVPAANWLIAHVGIVCVPDGPCLVPVWPGILAPSGVVLAGLSFVLRDLVQEALGDRGSINRRHHRGGNRVADLGDGLSGGFPNCGNGRLARLHQAASTRTGASVRHEQRHRPNPR